jgi:hypothetical protein
MALLKLFGGLILASLGFGGMVVAVLRYFVEQIQSTVRFPLDLPLDSSINYWIILGAVSLIAFIGGVYLIIRYSR